jgi:hypothetical protein
MSIGNVRNSSKAQFNRINLLIPQVPVLSKARIPQLAVLEGTTSMLHLLLVHTSRVVGSAQPTSEVQTRYRFQEFCVHSFYSLTIYVRGIDL